MQSLVSHLTRKARGGYVHRDLEVTSEIIRLGRGADSEVYLPDPRVPLHAAEIHGQPGGHFIQVVGPASLRVNGAATNSAQLKVGDKVALGPYDIEIVAPPEGKDFGLTVELVRPLGDDLEQLRGRSRLELSETWLTRRRMAWLLAVVVLALFLGMPLAGFVMTPPEARQNFVEAEPDTGPLATADQVWLSGEMSGPHKFFGAACEACHQQPFVQVRDDTCLSCHTEIEHHAEPMRFENAAGGTVPACQSCHKEHNGNEAIVLNDQAFCSGCHADFDKRLNDSALLNVSDFAVDHPQFRPTVVVEHETGRMQRISLSEKDKLVEQSGIKFPHDKHLVTENGGIRAPEGRRVLGCNDCHVVEPGGQGLLPIRMLEHCQECHQLTFDKSAPKRVVPHGKPKEVQEILKDFYAKAALRGGFDDPSAPAVVRRLPGTPLPPAAANDALAWAAQRADQAISMTFGKRLCGTCHKVVQDPDGIWDVIKPQIAETWMPKGIFHHASHETMTCGDCHEAAKSKVNTDVLLPGVESCQECHGGETATDKVPSTCIMCHQFHIEGQPRMAGEETRAAMRQN